ncbi:MAG: hypothetical protein AMJ65_02055 [Phycisphaerae bacterium SG8_4]|nr:MAG: hypothetical protein AMJ65_02055 [Phycisphaerae bacterium SG8_4]
MLQKVRQIPHNLIFLLSGLLYLWLVVEPRLIYQCFGTILPDAPIFLTGWSFLDNSLRLPGGPVMYVSGLLSQGYYYSWLGALIIVLSALCLCELSRRHLVAAGSCRATVLSSLPAVVLILLYSRYKHPLPACLAVSLGLACSLAFERLPWRRLVIRAMVYCLFAAAVFWLAGAGGLFVFSLMTVIYAVFIGRDFVLALLALPAGLGIIWYLALYAFIVPPKLAFSVLTPFSPEVPQGVDTFSTVLIIILYSFAPLCATLLLLGRKLFARIVQTPKKHSSKSRRKKRRTAGGKSRGFVVILTKTAAAAIPILVTAVGLYFSHDRLSKPLVQAHDYYLRKQWREILELSRNLPKGRSNVYFNHSVNRALYHTGRLPYDMFKFPQTPHGIFLTHEVKASYLTQMRLCDLFMELGRVNSAERLASEILASKNHSRIAVEKLAWINILKRQNDTARVYLNVLKKDPVCRGRARALLGYLDDGFAPDEAAYIDTIRPRMHQEGHRGAWDESIEQILTELLASNPANRMAFEYLMACYLITGRPDKIAASMGRLKEFAYDGVPTLYEEATLVYLGSKGQRVDLNKFNIKRETIDRYVEFVKLRNSLRPENRQIVLNRLISKFGSSYFFYSTFGRVGLL